jgi:hypothetical protein
MLKFMMAMIKIKILKQDNILMDIKFSLAMDEIYHLEAMAFLIWMQYFFPLKRKVAAL